MVGCSSQKKRNEEAKCCNNDWWSRGYGLVSETVKGPSLPLEGVNDVEGGNGLSLSVLGVGDGVPDSTLEESLEDSSGLLVDQSGDSLNTTSSSETSDSGLGDSLDVVTEDLPVTLGTTLSETLSTFTTTGHCC